MSSTLPVLLFLVYLAICCWLILRSSKIRLTGVDRRHWMAFFLVKVLAGAFYGYWYAKQPVSDTWHFHQEGLIEAELLRTDPIRYWSYLVDDYLRKPGGMLASTGFWNDLRDNLMVKLVSLMHLLSGGRYYVNVVMYEWITFWGLVYSALTFQTVKGIPMPGWAWLTCALLPSCLFWTSGIHRDGLVLLELAYIFYLLTKPGSRGLKWWTGMGIMWGLLFLTRNYVAILLVPGMLALWPGNRPRRWGLVFGSIYIITIAAICMLPAGREIILAKKASFEALEGNSRLPYLEIENNAASFIKTIPNSLARAVFFPEWKAGASGMQILAAAEGWILLSGWLLVLILSCKNNLKPTPLGWLLICFSISCLWIIGTIVPFSGAIVRYRAIFQYELVFACCLQFRPKLL